MSAKEVENMLLHKIEKKEERMEERGKKYLSFGIISMKS